ncbi:MAG: hypothetical protein FWC40_08180 [Proteobacteria bacterium]|nr:hypothetical protein [Pseudomonadota bacterium]
MEYKDRDAEFDDRKLSNRIQKQNDGSEYSPAMGDTQRGIAAQERESAGVGVQRSGIGSAQKSSLIAKKADITGKADFESDDETEQSTARVREGEKRFAALLRGDAEPKNSIIQEACATSKATGGKRLTNAPVEVDENLAKQGKKACAEGGSCVKVASKEVAEDPEALLHEDIHCLQQRLGKAPTEEGANQPSADHNLLENEANDCAEKLFAGSTPESVLTLTPTAVGRLYQEGNYCAAKPTERQTQNVYAGTPSKSEAELIEWICQAACECLIPELLRGQTRQNCVKNSIADEYYEGSYPKEGAQIWREVPFDRNNDWEVVGSKNDPNVPTNNYIRPNTLRPDAVLRDSMGKIIKIVEVKFPTDPTGGDNMDPERLEGYRAIAERHTGSKEGLQILDVAEECGCDDRKTKPKPETVPKLRVTKDLKALPGTETKQLTVESSLSWGEVLAEVVLFALQAIVARHPILRLQGDTSPKQLPRND